MYAKQNASLETLWLTWKSFPLPGRDICIRSAIFANHHIKYDVNKLCAQSLASLTNTGITCCAAKDHPTLDVLRARPDLPTKKLEWLKRHDSKSGDLYGVLPLMRNMPVAMTDRIDRGVDKRVLKGRVGHIHSWVIDKDETSTFANGKLILTRLPKVVFVKFLAKDGEELTWTLPGQSEPGVYPIVPMKKDWYLDKGRLHPVVHIKRRQLPLTPAFAMTAHAAQGQTFSKGAIVDLKLEEVVV